MESDSLVPSGAKLTFVIGSEAKDCQVLVDEKPLRFVQRFRIRAEVGLRTEVSIDLFRDPCKRQSERIEGWFISEDDYVLFMDYLEERMRREQCEEEEQE